MNSLRILHVSDAFPGFSAEVGGAEVIADRTIKLLGKAGFAQGLAIVSKIRKSITSYPIYGLESLEILDLGWLPAFKSQLFPFDPLVEESFYFALDDFKPDVVLLHNIKKIGLSVVNGCAHRSIPVIAFIYDYIYFCPTGMFVDVDGQLCRSPGSTCASCHVEQSKKLAVWSPKLLPLRDRLFSPLLGKVDRFVALSQASKDLLADIGIARQKIEVIPQTLPVEILQVPPVLSDPDRILFVGWGQRRKGLLVVAQALALLKKPFTFEAIGALVDPEYVGKVEEELQIAGLNPQHCLRGKVDDEELRQAMGRASIVVVAEQWENMSPAILHEAMSAGKAVIAGAVGGIPEFIDTGINGYLVKYDEPQGYAEILHSLLGNISLLQTIGANARRKALENCDNDLVLGRWQRLMNEVKRDNYNKELSAWLYGTTCVIICGGKGTRLGKVKGAVPKSLVPVAGVPILRRMMDFWAPYVSRFLLIIGHDAKEISEFCKTLPYDVVCHHEQETGRGVAAALLEAEGHVSGRFLMVLGDCLYQGPVHVPSGMDRGIGVFCGADVKQIKENYSVKVEKDGEVSRVIEKPTEPDASDFCGMGVYFLDGTIWRAIKETIPDTHGVVQITSVIQTLIDKAGVFPVVFEGSYCNINSPENLEYAEILFDSRMRQGA